MTWITLLAIAEVLWVLGFSGWIILERRSPVATLAWIFASAWMPLVGVGVYLLIGPRRLRRKRLRYATARSRVRDVSDPVAGAAPAGPSLPPPDHPLQQFMRLVERAGEGPPVRARRLQLLPSGDDCFAAIEQAIAQARHHVHLEYYIWEPDGVGTRFRDLLCQKAAQGVQVRLLLDAIGSSSLKRRFLQPLRDSGGEVAWFNSISVARFRPGLFNFRTHRKIVVCDGELGFTGGINLSDEESAAASGRRAWRDTHLLIEGPPVGWLQRVFLEDWHFATGSAPTQAAYFPSRTPPCDGPWVQIVASGPDHELYAIHKFFFSVISGARERVLLSTPYFVPDEAIFSALATAAMRGAEVKLLLPRRGDSRLVAAAARSYYADLVRLGVKIFEYGPAMLHAKTLVVDRDIAVVGTANMDNRSFRLNFEVMAAIYDGPTAAALAEMFAADLRHARAYCTRHARRASFWQRMAESTARLFSPLL